ncbi:MAG: hypothetical protein Athens101428_712 [Candidatus Berkelbacteria bacterium Athens1014_28]|uniref:TrpR like protein, YerC/YecD n=1 Tax=Candidatus Berkelbacteria bacterium Athens1014_28 TaxID=2017145 RepID=A0A554LKD2_9BACT|nr:MAG: hypothetical protein Athens101428_712 [Candidatus Berkelbacteria bacterium Athens1014_28]
MPKFGIDKEARQLLYDTIKRTSSDEFVELIESLMSSAELKDLSRRLMAAKYLKENSTYEEIADTMGMSESTINKIHFKTKGSPIINKLFKKD